MKIIDVAEFYAPRGGGVRTYIDLKLQAARACGHEVVIIAPGPRDQHERRAAGRVIWVASPQLPLDPRYRLFVREAALHEILDREAPQVIEASSPWGGACFVARYRAPRARVVKKSLVYHHDPVAVYAHTLLGGRLRQPRIDALCSPYWAYLRRLSARFDMTLCAGTWLEQRLRAHHVNGALAVPFGVDKRLFREAQPDPALRRELLRRAGAPQDAALLVTLSRLHPEKRLGTLLAAVQQLAKQRPVAWVVFGDGPLASYYRARARGLPVHFAGLTRDRALLARALASADVLLHGSSAETFGLSVAEALCASLPLVVPDAGGACDFAGAPYAETYRAGDARACAAAVQRHLAREPTTLRAACRAASDSRVLSHEQHWERLFCTYEALVLGRPQLEALGRGSGPRTGTGSFAFAADPA